MKKLGREFNGPAESTTLDSHPPRCLHCCSQGFPWKINHTLLLCPYNHQHIMLTCPLLRRKVISHPTQIFWDCTYVLVCIPALSTRERKHTALLCAWLLTDAAICRNRVQGLSRAYCQPHLQQHVCCQD